MQLNLKVALAIFYHRLWIKALSSFLLSYLMGRMFYPLQLYDLRHFVSDRLRPRLHGSVANLTQTEEWAMKSLIRLLQQMQLFLFRSSKKFKNQNSPFNICDKMQTVRNVLVCFPSDPAILSAGVEAVGELRKLFPQWRITLIMSEKSMLTGLRNLTLLGYSEKQLTFFGLPKKSLVQNLLKSKFDLAIDLSPAYDFKNLAIAWKSEAGLRFGFYHPAREDFYNFLLRQRADAEPAQACQALVNTIGSF